MAREILFRGQTRKTGQRVYMDGRKVPGNWVYGGICLGKGDFSIIYAKMDEEKENPIEKHVVYTETVGQYTGLKDKNGKMIFEGDILKDDWGKIYRVFYTTKSCSFMASLPKPPNEWETGNYRIGSAWCETIQVIGNIHDNPDLLEVK